MTFQAYLESIKAQTGKTPADFKALAAQKGLLGDGVKTGQVVAWLQEDFGLGRGHAMAIIQTFRSASQPRLSIDEQVAKHFGGDRVRWRAPYDELMAQVSAFGPDVSVAPTDTYISLLRGGKKFAIAQVTAGRLDIGIKLKGAEPTDRFEAAGSWNSMVTHRVRVSDPQPIDADVLEWLKHAYDRAK